MNQAPRFEGTFAAVPTPYYEWQYAQPTDPEHIRKPVDREAFMQLIEEQREAGNGIVPNGTTGESPTNKHNYDEAMLFRMAKEGSKGEVPVILGTGSNSTDETIQYSLAAKEAGADGVLLVTPYYNKPSQAGLIEHFRKVLGTVRIPGIIYNVPGRTGVNMLPETIVELAQTPEAVDNLAAIKEASGKIEQVEQLTELLQKNNLGHISVLSGSDEINVDIIEKGGHGVISVLANAIPQQTHQMVELARAGKFKEAYQMAEEWQDLVEALFIPGEGNPVCVKQALTSMDKVENIMRLPLVPVATEARQQIEDVLRKHALIQ